MDNADAGIDGGFVLTANGYEKNCSFAALLRDVRAQEESALTSLTSEEQAQMIALFDRWTQALRVRLAENGLAHAQSARKE